MRHDGKITLAIAREALELMEIDGSGLERADRALLRAIVDKFEGGPVGIATLAAATSEEEDAIMDVYEPYLIQLGFLQRTPRGRVATRRAYEHLRRPYAPSANARVAAQMSFLGAEGEGDGRS